MDADTAVDGRMRKLENATLGVAERHAGARDAQSRTARQHSGGVSMSCASRMDMRMAHVLRPPSSVQHRRFTGRVLYAGFAQ